MKLLKEYLDSHGISKQWLADSLGITKQNLYLKLNDKSSFTLKQAFQVKELLRLTDAEFNLFFSC